MMKIEGSRLVLSDELRDRIAWFDSLPEGAKVWFDGLAGITSNLRWLRKTKLGSWCQDGKGLENQFVSVLKMVRAMGPGKVCVSWPDERGIESVTAERADVVENSRPAVPECKRSSIPKAEVVPGRGGSVQAPAVDRERMLAAAVSKWAGGKFSIEKVWWIEPAASFGRYMQECPGCHLTFTGFKRDVTCGVCSKPGGWAGAVEGLSIVEDPRQSKRQMIQVGPLVITLRDPASGVALPWDVAAKMVDEFKVAVSLAAMKESMAAPAAVPGSVEVKDDTLLRLVAEEELVGLQRELKRLHGVEKRLEDSEATVSAAQQALSVALSFAFEVRTAGSVGARLREKAQGLVNRLKMVIEGKP